MPTYDYYKVTFLVGRRALRREYMVATLEKAVLAAVLCLPPMFRAVDFAAATVQRVSSSANGGVFADPLGVRGECAPS